MVLTEEAMIIQTGQRTDIPAFYSEWFLNRIREGFVLVRNPYNEHQVTRYRLDPKVVDVIGFCSKNPAPLLPHMEELGAFPQIWHVTITPYGRDIEPHVPPKEKVCDDLCRISERLGRRSVHWRYDPILLTEEYTVSRHVREFEKMAARLKGYTGTAVISFVDLFEKVRRNFPEARKVMKEDRLVLGREMAAIAADCGMTLRPCGEGEELAVFGADCRGCITTALYEQAVIEQTGNRLRFPKSLPRAREDCACYLSCDIGAYDSCGHLCRYCYANSDPDRVRANRRHHDPASPFLIGGPMEGDVIHEAAQESWVDRQIRLEL